MELFEQIRREYEHGVGTIKGVARKFGVHRRMVRDAIASAVPPARKAEPRERPKLVPATAFIEEILQPDRKAPRKQRHTAHRIWVRLQREMPDVMVAESTVRRFVHKSKGELGLTGGGETFIPQSYHWGQEAQVDWYEAWAELGGERQKLYVFCMRSMASGGAFHRAYQARLRWAVMQEGHGLDHWREVEHIFQSDSREAAFEEALRIGRSQEYVITPDRPAGPSLEYRLAEVVYPEEHGTAPAGFTIPLAPQPATERIGFEHEFNPESGMPEPAL